MSHLAFPAVSRLLLCLLLLTLAPPHAVAAAETPAVNATQAENAKPGTTDWQLANPGRATRVIEGYASLTSVNRGGQIKLFVNTSEPGYTIDVFRIGYYGGLGARRLLPTIARTGTAQPEPTLDPATGLIECAWRDPYVLTVPNSADPTDWMTGIYLAKLTTSVSHTQQYIVFVVRDDARPTDLLMAQTVGTYQAYNPWGGKSLYGTLLDRSDTANKAMKVSFDRPYYGDETNGAGEFFHWEHWMVRWLEAEGYDMSYATNVDVDANATLLLSHKAFLSVGHDEYWSWKMRDNVEYARDHGVSLGFFSANTSYWQVRFEPSLITGDPARTMVGYKDFWSQDPITPDYLKTNEFRYAPVNRPEDAMIGVFFVTQARPALVVEDASHWVFTSTGLNNGDRLTNPDGSSFLGYEVDAVGPQSPANVQRLAHSPVGPGHAYFSDMTVYRAPSGATVFASGSIAWSQTIPAIQQVTRNVLARFIVNAFADTTPVRAQVPAPFVATDIGDVGRAGFIGAADVQSLTLNGAGQDTYRAADAVYYVSQPLTGDGAIVARLTGLQNYWDNRAGVTVRESLAPSAKYVALRARPSETSGVLSEGVDLWARATVNTIPYAKAQLDSPMPNWLKLARAGDTFTAWVSTDGATWSLVGSTVVPMASSVYIGVDVLSAQRGVWATASFDNIVVTSGGGAPAQPPTLPGTPSPANGATGVSIAPTLAWSSTYATSYEVAFGTSNPPPTVKSDQTAPSYTPGALASGTHYFWQVLAKNSVGTAGGPVWSFTTIGEATAAVRSPWTNVDVGNTGQVGVSSYTTATGTFTVRGAGADIWGTADGFQYVYQPLNGDGEIISRVTTIGNTNPYAKAGVMIRESLTANAAHVILDMKPNGEIEFMTRASSGAGTNWLSGMVVTAPTWLKLTRSASTIAGSVSANGTTWTLVGTTTLLIPAAASFGLVVTSHDTAVLNTSTFDNVSVSTATVAPSTPASPYPADSAGSVSVTPTLTWTASGAAGYDVKFGSANPPTTTVATNQPGASYTPATLTKGTKYFWQVVARNSAGSTTGAIWSFTTGGLPEPWSNQDIGAVGLAGSAAHAGGQFTVYGAGADIWGTADGFQYVYQPLNGNGQIVARVVSVQNTNTFAKAGVMVRETLTAGSRHVILDLRPNGNIEFMSRTATGGSTTYIGGATQLPPTWLKLARSGTTISASVSVDGITWTTIGQTTVAIPSSVYVGIVVTSHVSGTLNTSAFDNVTVTPMP